MHICHAGSLVGSASTSALQRHACAGEGGPRCESVLAPKPERVANKVHPRNGGCEASNRQDIRIALQHMLAHWPHSWQWCCWVPGKLPRLPAVPPAWVTSCRGSQQCRQPGWQAAAAPSSAISLGDKLPPLTAVPPAWLANCCCPRLRLQLAGRADGPVAMRGQDDVCREGRLGQGRACKASMSACLPGL